MKRFDASKSFISLDLYNDTMRSLYREITHKEHLIISLEREIKEYKKLNNKRFKEIDRHWTEVDTIDKLFFFLFGSLSLFLLIPFIGWILQTIGYKA